LTSRTPFIGSSEDKAITSNKNAVLPVEALISFLEKNFACKKCARTITRRCEDGHQQAPLIVLIEVFGIACRGVTVAPKAVLARVLCRK
jgi:hypothetical protein